MTEIARVEDSRQTIFLFIFHPYFLFLDFLFWELRVRVSVMSHCHKSVTNHMMLSWSWPHDHMSHRKDNVIQHV